MVLTVVKVCHRLLEGERETASSPADRLASWKGASGDDDEDDGDGGGLVAIVVSLLVVGGVGCTNSQDTDGLQFDSDGWPEIALWRHCLSSGPRLANQTADQL